MTDPMRATRSWVENIVIKLNLCPFARREWQQNSVRVSLSDAATEEALLEHVIEELSRLKRRPEIETTLIIHPEVLREFGDYNQFLGIIDMAIENLGLEGIFQVASFHPDYQFADTEYDDAENYTNRSPYPMLHLLREDSLEQSVLKHPDPSSIPLANIDLMRRLGAEKMSELLRQCCDDGQ